MDFKNQKFSILKCSAKSLCGLLKEIYTLSKFVKTRTIHITNRQGKIFFLIFPVFSKPQLLENTLQFSTKPYTK